MAYADALVGIRDGLAAVVAAQVEAWQAAGCPPTMSVDGESYDWNGWLAGKLDALDRLNDQIRRASGPFIARTRGRA